MEAALALRTPTIRRPTSSMRRASSSRSELTRRYGAGDTAVDALRGVSLEIPRGHLTAVMGPSGSGKSTLMHILAGLDKPSSGTVEIDGVEHHDAQGQRPDEAPPPPHRLRLPVLQPAADAVGRGEHHAAAVDRRHEARARLARGAARGDRPRRPPQAPARPSSRAASSSASPSRARSSRGRRCSSPTSRRATSTRRRPPRSSGSSAAPSTTYGQTTVMVTHDPKAATIADRDPLPRRRPDRQGARPLDAGRDPRRSQRLGSGVAR